MADSKIDQLRKRRDQLNARIQKESAKKQQQDRKARNARLVQWGIVAEQMIQRGDMEAKQWAAYCRQYLTKPRDLERALTGPLDGISQTEDGQPQYEPQGQYGE